MLKKVSLFKDWLELSNTNDKAKIKYFFFKLNDKKKIRYKV